MEKGGIQVSERDRRLALIIIGLLLAIPLAWALTTYIVERVVELFI